MLSQTSLTTLPITNEDADLCRRMRRRSSLSSATALCLGVSNDAERADRGSALPWVPLAVG